MTWATLLLTASTFALGFCMARVSLCAVATVRALVQHRQASGVAALAVAAATAGVLLIGSALLTGHQALASGPMVSVSLAIGGILLGLGALLNGGCYLSSVSYVGTGNYHYLLTLAGFAMTAHFLPATPQAAVTPMRPFLPLAAGLVVFVLIGFLALRHGYGLRAGAPAAVWRSRWPWPLAALACGGCAALVNLQFPDWSYSRLLDSLARSGATVHWPVVLPAVAIFAGAISSSLLAGQFELPRPSALKAARCLGGGALMGYAAAQVPGGNDSLLLWAIPSLALYGLVAYLLMLATISCALACAQLAASWRARVLPRA